MDIKRATRGDIGTIQQIAGLAFPPTFEPIIGKEQVAYMMQWMYSTESLERQMAGGHTYQLGFEGGRPVGYASLERQGGRLFHLQKLYVVPAEQRKGFGKALFEAALALARELAGGPCTMELNVNRHNLGAIEFYKRRGMRVARQGDFEIGSGYYMNDYIMALELG